MKYAELTATPDPESVPPFFEVIADAPFVAEARLVDWNLGDIERPTLLYSVTGDEAAFREAIEQTAVPVEWDVTTIDSERFYCYLRAAPVSQLETVLEAASTDGLVVVKPVVYCDGCHRPSCRRVRGATVVSPIDAKRRRCRRSDSR